MTTQYNSKEKRKFKKVKFRLPSEEEWIVAAKVGIPTATYPWEGNDLKTNKNLIRCNFKRGREDSTGEAGKLNDNADVTAPSESYWPNKYGLYTYE